MKRLLVAGAKAIYQIGKAFRGGEIGDRHNPEFSMLEWYRAGDDYAAGRDLLSDFASQLLDRPPAEQITYRDLFEDRFACDPFVAGIDQLKECCRTAGIAVSRGIGDDPDRDTWLNLLFGQAVEPALGRDVPLIVYDWPASQAALAQIRDDHPPVAERFELFVDGVELANGYHELLDPGELLARNRAVNQVRASDGTKQLPEESRLLEAMRHGMPPCCGVAVGVDRMLMVATGCRRIEEVIPFPLPRA